MDLVTQYFHDRLIGLVCSLGGSAESVQGSIKTQVIHRDRGLTHGLLDVYYFGAKGKKFRNRVEVVASMGLSPAVRQLRSLTRGQHFILAQEHRERFLVAQKIPLLMETFRADRQEVKIVYEEDEIQLLVKACNVAGEDQPTWKVFQADADEYVSYGNMTILKWGKIQSSNSQFHNATQIFPEGFRCLRQELDLALDRVVDCLFEISSVTDLVKGEALNVPLFRLTVAWQVDGEEVPTSADDNSSQDELEREETTAAVETVVRVYEARSLPHLWQAAMLESVGTDLLELPSTTVVDAGVGVETSEVIDGSLEEVELRKQVRDERRAYFKALRHEQSLGTHSAMKPRLQLDQMEGFADDMVTRLIEGMTDAADCPNYVFMEARERSLAEAGKKYLFRVLAKSQVKLYSLDRVLAVQYPFHNDKDKIEQEYSRISEKRKLEKEGNEPKKKLKSLDADQDAAEVMDVGDEALREPAKFKQGPAALRKARLRALVRDIEKTMRASKENILKNLRRRKEEARLRVTIICDGEEVDKGLQHHQKQEKASILDEAGADLEKLLRASPRPHPPQPLKPGRCQRPPSKCPTCIPPSVFSGLLEVSSFVRSFSSILRMKDRTPTLDSLVNSLRCADIRGLGDCAATCSLSSMRHTFFYEALLGLLGDSHREALVIQDPDCEVSRLDELGAAIARTLSKDYCKCMGIDVNEMLVTSDNLPVNKLTWREVARVSLLGVLTKEIGMSDADLSSTLRGRGYVQVTDAADRKLMKLIRKRISTSYAIRNEFQESVFGCRSGLVVRLPSPKMSVSSSFAKSTFFRTFDKLSLRNCWLLKNFALILLSWFTEPTISNRREQSSESDSWKDLRAKLIEIVDESFSSSKLFDKTLQSLFCNLRASFSSGDCEFQKAPAESSHWPLSLRGSMWEERKSWVLHALQEWQLPASALDVPSTHWEDWLRQIVLLSVRFASPIPVKSLQENGIHPSGSLASLFDEVGDAADIPIHSMEILGEGNNGLDSDDDEVGEGDDDLYRPSTKDEITPTKVSEDGSGGAGAGNGSVPLAVDPTQDEFLEEDLASSENVSVCMQRCFAVVRELMNHPNAIVFCRPVDTKVLPQYARVIAQPLSLMDIRRAVAQGKYEGSLMAFYSDLNLLFDNAFAFNLENASVNQSCQRLVIVFERLFLEMVLSWDDAMTSSECCPLCRSVDFAPNGNSTEECSLAASNDSWTPPKQKHSNGIASSSAGDREGSCVFCDHCEARYHIHCLDPPLSCIPRGDWFCPACIEQKSVATVHPNNLSRVRHPENPEVLGEVVGIEQRHHSLFFTLQFTDSTREQWRGEEVRRCCIDEDGHRPVLPPGYDFEDFDLVCGFARGYSGWKPSHSLIPPFLEDHHSKFAQARTKINPYFSKLRAALGMLSPQVSDDELTSQEWIMLLRGLTMRAVSTSEYLVRINKPDDITDGVAAECMNQILAGRANLSSLLHCTSQLFAAPDNNEEDGYQSNDDDDELADIDADGETGAVLSQRGPITRPSSRMSQRSGSAVPAEVVKKKKSKNKSRLALARPVSRGGIVNLGAEMSLNLRAQHAELSPPEQAVTAETNSEPMDGISLSQDISLETSRRNEDDPMGDNENEAMGEETALQRWDLRRSSRKKGREDALVTKALLQAAISETEEDLLDIDGEYYQSLCNAAVKCSIVRPSADVDVVEWERAWASQMSCIHCIDDDGEASPNSDELVCGHCGFDQDYLASPFVWGQSWNEWIMDGATGVVVTDKRRKLVDESGRNKVWMPHHPKEYEMEMSEFSSTASQRMPRRGSLIVHECCAEYMAIARQIALGRVERTEEQKMIDILVGIGKGKVAPIGSDSTGSLYWVFLDSRALFVFTPEHQQEYLDPIDSKANSGLFPEDDVHAVYRWLQNRGTACEGCDGVSSFPRVHGSGTWTIYENSEDVGAVIDWLTTEDNDERQLKNLLQILFPDACSTERKNTDESERIAPRLSEVCRSVDRCCSELHLVTTHQAITTVEVDNEEDLESISGSEDLEEDDIEPELPRADPGPASEERSEILGHRKENRRNQDSCVVDDDLEEAEWDENDPSIYYQPNDDDPKKVVVELDETDKIIAEPENKRTSRHVACVSPHETANSFTVGERVLISVSENEGSLYSGRILDKRQVTFSGNDESTAEATLYLIRFDKWGARYDGWYNSTSLHVPRRKLSSHARNRNVNEAGRVPDELRSLRASSYYRRPGRACGYQPRLCFSAASGKSQLQMLKMSLLLVEAALPMGALDEGEDKWGEDEEQFASSWRGAVFAASNAEDLMGCQLMLELSIRAHWVKPQTTRLLSCMPSRSVALRTATLSSVAMRLWMLDAGIRYEKIAPIVRYDDGPKDKKYPKGGRLKLVPTGKRTKH